MGGLVCSDFEVKDDLKSSDAAEKNPLLLERDKPPFFLPKNVSRKLDLHSAVPVLEESVHIQNQIPDFIRPHMENGQR